MNVPDDNKVKFTEISAERINVTDADGTVRMVISGKDKAPGWVVGGKDYPGRPPQAGIIFYDNEGTECGGLVFDNDGSGLMFDRKNQDQIIGLSYAEEDGQRMYGLNIWDRPDAPLSDMVDKFMELRSMPPGEERTKLGQELSEKWPSPLRIFVGREEYGDKDQVQVKLTDSKGRTRIRLVVDREDSPKIEVLDEDGNVIDSLPKQK